VLQERIRMTQQDVAAFVSDLRAAMEELQVELPDAARVRVHDAQKVTPLR